MFLFRKSPRGKNGRGARRLLLSTKGTVIKQATPMASMMMSEGFFQDELLAKLKGMRMSATDPEIRISPRASNSNQRLVSMAFADRPLNGEGGSRPRLAAFRWLISRVNPKGVKAPGSTIAQTQ